MDLSVNSLKKIINEYINIHPFGFVVIEILESNNVFFQVVREKNGSFLAEITGPNVTNDLCNERIKDLIDIGWNYKKIVLTFIKI